MKVSVLMNKYNEDSIDSVLRQLHDVEMFVAETDKIED
jgi:hypothetical protein